MGGRVHLTDLVRRNSAKSATWEYIEDTDHVTRGVMHWVVTLKGVSPSEECFVNGRYIRTATRVIKLAHGAELITDEYVAQQVLERLEAAA